MRLQVQFGTAGLQVLLKDHIETMQQLLKQNGRNDLKSTKPVRSVIERADMIYSLNSLWLYYSTYRTEAGNDTVICQLRVNMVVSI